MSMPATPEQRPAPEGGRPASGGRGAGPPSGGLLLFRIAAIAVIVVAAAVIAWLALRDNGGEKPSNATAVSAAQLDSLAASLGHPIFWLGPKAGTTYELIQTSTGSVYVRYLPQGVDVGASEPYLTVATYPFRSAYAAVRALLEEPGTTSIELSRSGIAETSTRTPTSVHAAYPGVDYQVEVFDPTPGTAAALVRAGQLTPIGGLGTTSSGAGAPSLTSPAGLKTLAASLGHPLYWAGTKAGTAYEVTKTADGQVTVRYLPAGQPAGAAGQYLTIGTYPYPKAFDAIKALSQQQGAVVIELEDGGLAVVDRNSARNIHLAYPGSDYQIEVFDPSPAVARRIVSSGELQAAG